MLDSDVGMWRMHWCQFAHVISATRAEFLDGWQPNWISSSSHAAAVWDCLRSRHSFFYIDNTSHQKRKNPDEQPCQTGNQVACQLTCLQPWWPHLKGASLMGYWWDKHMHRHSGREVIYILHFIYSLLSPWNEEEYLTLYCFNILLTSSLTFTSCVSASANAAG